MGSRWVFTEDGSAIQVSHITRLTVGKTGETDRPYSVLAHITGQLSPTRIHRYATRIGAEEAVKDMVVGREHLRS